MKGKMNSTVWMLLVFAWVAIAVSQIITFGYGMMMPSIVAELGVDEGTMGVIAGVASWVTVLLTIPGAVICVRLNPKYSVPVVTIGMAIGLFLYGTANGVFMMYVSRIIAAAFAQLIATCLVGTKMRGVPAESMTQINGIENFVGPIGQVIATLVIVQLMLFLGGWRGIYIGIAIIMVIAAALYFVLYGNGGKVTTGAEQAAPPEDTTDTFAALKEALSNKVVLLTSLAWPGTTIVWIAMFYFWPSYAQYGMGLTPEQCGVVLAMIPIFSAIASLTSPMLANKLGYDKPFIWPWGIILPVCYYMMTVVSSVPLLMLFSAVAGYGAYCFVPMAFTNVYKLGMSPKAVTFGTGMILTFVAVGAAIAGTVLGALYAATGDLKAVIQISCLTPVWFGLLTFFLPELGRKKMEEIMAAMAANK